MAERYFEGVGRRKASSARVRVTKGTGEFTVNGKSIDEFFPRMGDKENAISPIVDAGLASGVNVSVLVKGGGVTGQSGAVRMGLGRALTKMDESLSALMHSNGHMTRDSRMKERKKPGLKRARKAPTYTKR